MTRVRLGILGGTFDPIHLGHLAVARAAATALRLDTVLFVPSHHPPHRHAAPRESAYHRFAMVALAIADEPGFTVSDIELRRNLPSYTSRTLRALAAEGFDRSQMFFITGADAFAEITTWNEYPEVLDLSHFVVVSRPGYPVDLLERRLPDLRTRIGRTDGLEANTCSGNEQVARIYVMTAATPDISSTIIRARLGDGQSVAGLVTPIVERHILQHRLYTRRRPAGPVSADP